MIGATGTGAVLRSVGELCGPDQRKVRQAVWAELGTTAKLPWYVRLHAPETFRGVRAAIFGDFTRTLGLGYALSREVGLEVGACGTYLTHLERDFLFHASTFTEGAFAADDPDAAASRIEGSQPDVLIGTHLEAELAQSLGIPFLQLCPPVLDHPFVERPIMGYRGSSVLADALDDALRRPDREQREAEPQPAGLPWTGEALEGLEEIPAFLRGRTRRLAEARARAAGSREVTREHLDEARN
jgi:light-independent protochlorophyllide reductase subunit B